MTCKLFEKKNVFDTISGNGSNYITLNFRSMKTECSYDYLFVYDGNSYSDDLLGSFSGQTLPDTVVATSGYVSKYALILD